MSRFYVFSQWSYDSHVRICALTYVVTSLNVYILVSLTRDALQTLNVTFPKIHFGSSRGLTLDKCLMIFHKLFHHRRLLIPRTADFA